jgi:hypothetical protein
LLAWQCGTAPAGQQTEAITETLGNLFDPHGLDPGGR